MITYLKHKKNSTKNLLDPTNSFSEVSGYKISLQKSVSFLLTNNEPIENEYRKTSPLKMATKK
jgi:hypothetical protein